MRTLLDTAFSLASKTDALNAHLDACALCREAQRRDADPCPEGERLSRIADEAYAKAHGQRLAELDKASGT